MTFHMQWEKICLVFNAEQLSLSLAVLRFEDCSYICNLPKVINHIQNIVSARSDVHFIGFADTGPCFLDHTGKCNVRRVMLHGGPLY